MSPNKPFTVLELPETSSQMFQYLERIGVETDRNVEKKVTTVLRRFNQLAQQGYDLSLANGTAELEALKTLNLHTPLYVVDDYRILAETRHNKQGEQFTASDTWVKVTVDGKQRQELAESTEGSFHGLYQANVKILKKFLHVADPVKLIKGGFHTDTFDDDDSSAARVRVTIAFDNGYSTQMVHKDSQYAQLKALEQAFDLDLLLRKRQRFSRSLSA